MPIASDDLRLFGLDLRNIWHDLKAPWAKLTRTPAWSWLAPRVEIMASGDEAQGKSLWEPDSRTRGFRRKARVEQDSANPPKADFEARLLPESLLLRKRLVMPLLDSDKMQQALSLEAANSNPFASSGIVWGYAINQSVATPSQDVVAVDMVLASRERVEQFLASRNANGAVGSEPEVWALLQQRDDAAMLVPGFGETRRAKRGQRYWASVALLAGVTLALGIAVAITPYLQLRARGIQANLAYAALDKEAGPQVGKREGLVKIEDQVKVLASIIGHRLDTLQVVQALTKALPDDTMLQRLQIEGRKVMIAGQAADSASLMQKLGGMPEVKEVRALSAAVRQPGMVKETFQIEFQLTDDFGVSASDAATAAALAPLTAASGAASTPVVAASAPSASASVPASATAPAAVPSTPPAQTSAAVPAPAPAAAVAQPKPAPAPVPTPVPAAQQPKPAAAPAEAGVETIGGR